LHQLFIDSTTHCETLSSESRPNPSDSSLILSAFASSSLDPIISGSRDHHQTALHDVSASQQEYQAVCITADHCGTGSVTVNVSAVLPLGTLPQPPISEPSTSYAVNYDQQLLHALSVTCPAGPSGGDGSDLPLLVMTGARSDDDDIYEDGDVFECEGHVAEIEGRAYYRDVSD
jgi:hypothetical protein